MALTQNGICAFGWKACDFALVGIDGKTYSLADARGPKGTLVVFICNHCPYVKAGIGRIVQEAPHTEQLHVVERFRIVEGGKALEAIAHVEDPGAFTMPWSAMQRYRRADRGPMGEAVCAENNATFFGYDNIEPIPTAGKPDF
jgi:AhpC/TSA family